MSIALTRLGTVTGQALRAPRRPTPPMKCWLRALRQATSLPCRGAIRPASHTGLPLLLRFVGNETVAEDLLSDVFFDVWQQAGRFEGRAAVTTWLLSIARFKALSARRRRTDAALDETIETTVADSADNPEIALQKKSRGELVRAALTKLSAEHREILDLVYYHEKSVEDCALILNIPVATVKTRMFYARKKLAALVQEA